MGNTEVKALCHDGHDLELPYTRIRHSLAEMALCDKARVPMMVTLQIWTCHAFLCAE